MAAIKEMTETHANGIAELLGFEFIKFESVHQGVTLICEDRGVGKSLTIDIFSTGEVCSMYRSKGDNTLVIDADSVISYLKDQGFEFTEKN